MARFEFTRLHEMAPRPGVKYSTTYIKQSPAEYQRLNTWLIRAAEDIMGILELDPELARWFSHPHPDFHTSKRGRYYSPEDLLTDMIRQMSLGRDLPHAMLDRWNRLCENTPWEIEFYQTTAVKKPRPQVNRAVFE
jgi:hypothetical protein